MPRQLSLFVTTILLALLISIAPTKSAWSQIDQGDWPAGVVPREELSKDRSYNYDFTNISVRTLQSWLGRIGVTLPVELDGDLVGWVWVQRSKDGWLDFSNYRVEGEIRSPELQIEKWSVAEAEVRFGFAEGNWYVGNLSGVMQSPVDQSRIGIASANAKILTASTAMIELNAKVDRIDLKSLLQAFGIDIGINNSGGSVVLSGEVPIASPSDLSKWSATTVLKLDDVVAPWIESPGGAFATVKLSDGAWNLSEGRLDVAGQDLDLAAAGRLDAELPFEVSLSGRKIETSQLLRQLKNQELAGQLAGVIQLDAKATGSQANGIENATAIVQSETLTVRAQPVNNVTLRAGYTPTKIRLGIDSAELAGGIVKGSAAWPDIKHLSRGIPSTAAFDINDLNLEQLGWLNLPVLVRGRATGRVEFATQTRDNADDWSSTGRVEVDGLEAAGTKFGLSKLDWNKELVTKELTGTITVSQGKGSFQSRIVTRLGDDPGSLLRATELVEYRAEGQLQNYDFIARYGDEPSAVIPIRAVGSFDVTGSPANWFERGTAQLSNSLAMLGDRLLRLEMANLSFTADEFRLERFRLLDPNGRIAGAASLRRDNMGEHLLRLRVVGVELKPYLERLAPDWLKSLDGKMAVELELKKDATTNSLSDSWNGQWKGGLTELSFKGQPIGDLELNGEVVDQILSANAAGQLLGGAAIASFRFPMSIVSDEPPAIAEPASLQIQLGKLQAKRLAGLFFDRNFASEIDGTASLQFSAEGHSLNDVVVTTQIELPRVVQRQMVLARDFNARIRYAGNTLFIERFFGGFAGGRIDARGQLQFDDEQLFKKISGGKINFVARRLDASNMVAMVEPAYAKNYSGAVNYQGTATFHRGVQLRGIATAKNANLLGFPVQIARGEVQTEFSPNFEFRQVVSNDLHGTAIGGTFNAALAIKGGNQFSLKTSGQVTRGKLEQLSRALGFSQIVGSGTFDGRFALQSRQIESLNAVTGGLRIDFESGDVKSIPVISSLDRFVPLTQFASTDIESGSLNAKLGQGQLRILDLILTSKAFLLVANGSASLNGTKLDIDAVLQTGGGVQQRATQTALELMLVSSVPQVVAITEINELIRNRAIFVHVGGSPSRPVIQANAGQTAARAFLQSFGRRTVGTSPLKTTDQ